MIGAIIGDVVGSRFEFDNNHKSREFELFTPECDFTDDTVMTIAVAEALLDASKDAGEDEIKGNVIKSMKKWGKKYPYAGYGSRFIDWVLSDESEPYGSYGNGSGMRVSAAGWLYDTIERTREVARWTAEVTHNHPEGIKGAESTAAAIFLARNGASKEEIRSYIEDEFGYDLSRTLDEISPDYYHVEDCMHTMPEAFECYFEADSYENCLRNVMYIGGDTDTLGAIAGAIAEASWGVPISLLVDSYEFIPEDIQEVIRRFTSVMVGPSAEDIYQDNIGIKMLAEQVNITLDGKDLMDLVSQVIQRIKEEGQVPTAMEDVNNAMEQLDLSQIMIGDTFTIKQEMRLRMTKLIDDDGNRWVPLFTDMDEFNKHAISNLSLNMPIKALVEEGYYVGDVAGVVINPFGAPVKLDKELLKMVIENA